MMNRRDLLKTSAALGLAATLPMRAIGQMLSTSNPKATQGAASAAPGAKTWVCPPCGLPCDKLTFDHPGDCPNCAMTLVPAQAGADSPPTVAILLFNGAELIDFAGPWEVFGAAGFLVHTVAEKSEPIIAVFGEKIIPDYTFDNSPGSDIVLVPGGGVWNEAIHNERLIRWIQTQSKQAGHVMSVCTGAFLLQKAGLLAGQTVTTTFGMIEDLNTPGTNAVYDRRYVDNGKVITTAGLTAGIDGALHLVSRILGRGTAQSVALGLEYKWDPDGKWARAALADRYLPDGMRGANPNIKGARTKRISTEGNTEHWTTTLLVSGPSSAAEVVELMRTRIAATTASGGMFKPTSHLRGAPRIRANKGDDSKLQWTFTDDQGSDWNGSCAVEPSQEEKGQFLVTLKVARIHKSAIT